MDTNKQIQEFFHAYEKRFNDALHADSPDIISVVESFAECFVEASPVGIICGKNDEDFRKAIPQGYEHYKNIGITSMNILSNEITVLDDDHAMAKIQWNSVFTRKDSSTGEFAFQVIYFLQAKENTFKIFGYITGDEKRALKELGLIP